MKTKNKKAKVLESIETRTIKKFLLIVGIILFLMWVMDFLRKHKGKRNLWV